MIWNGLLVKLPLCWEHSSRRTNVCSWRMSPTCKEAEEFLSHSSTSLSSFPHCYISWKWKHVGNPLSRLPQPSPSPASLLMNQNHFSPVILYRTPIYKTDTSGDVSIMEGTGELTPLLTLTQYQSWTPFSFIWSFLKSSSSRSIL